MAVLTILSAILGAAPAYVGVTEATGAPQQAAAAAVGLAMAVIPYVVTRCLEIAR